MLNFTKQKSEDNRFRIISDEALMNSSDRVRILKDKITGVHYVHTYNTSSNGSSRGGLTVLLDRDGKPVID